jgi:hypothetical protein
MSNIINYELDVFDRLLIIVGNLNPLGAQLDYLASVRPRLLERDGGTVFYGSYSGKIDG